MKHLLSLFVALLLIAPQAEAAIGGKKTVYIHGLQTKAFTSLLDPNRDAVLREDAQAQAGPFLRGRFDDFIYFDSAKRLSSNSASLYSQVKRIESSRLCQNGCYFMTASTGDLVARYIMSRLNQWQVDPAKFRVLLSFDLVGAGGGTEGADTIVSIVEGNPVSLAVNAVLATFFFGSTINFGDAVGIINDLRPSIARQTATQSSAVPRLRIVGGEETFLISSFLRGGDDSVVPMHSACGSARAESVYSCSRSIRLDGRVASADGPSSFWYNHFPIVMGKDMQHTEIDYTGTLVAVNNGKNFGPFRYDVNETTRSTGWWIFKKYYRTINKPSTQLAVEFLVNEIEN